MSSLTNEFPTKFTIYRDSWLRGEGESRSYLYREEDGLMCCLGQVAIQCGLSKEQIEGECTLDGLIGDIPASAIPAVFLKPDERLRFYMSSEFANNAMTTNDDETIDNSLREEKLIKLAKENGLDFEFVDGEIDC